MCAFRFSQASGCNVLKPSPKPQSIRYYVEASKCVNFEAAEKTFRFSCDLTYNLDVQGVPIRGMF